MLALITQIAGMNQCLDSGQMWEAVGRSNMANDLADITLHIAVVTCNFSKFFRACIVMETEYSVKMDKKMDEFISQRKARI